MKVYGHPLSPCTRKVLVTLAEKERTAAFVHVDLFVGEQKTGDYMKRHPFGMVPVLDDDGFVLYESRAIIRYLDARLGGVRLTPEAPEARARMDQWMSVDQSYVAPHTRALAIQRVVRKHEGLAPDDGAVREAEGALGYALGILDCALDGAGDGGGYLAGPAFSLADVSLMPYVASLSTVGAEHLLEGVPRLRAWWERVRARPSWQRAVSAA